MKKIILLAVVALAFTLNACRKTRTCDCSTTDTTVSTFGNVSNTSTSTHSQKITMDKQTKKYFRVSERCYNMTTVVNTTLTGGSAVVTSERNCTLK